MNPSTNGGEIRCSGRIGKNNKSVDIKFSVHDTFLESPSSGTLKIERLETHSCCTSDIHI